MHAVKNESINESTRLTEASIQIYVQAIILVLISLIKLYLKNSSHQAPHNTEILIYSLYLYLGNLLSTYFSKGTN